MKFENPLVETKLNQVEAILKIGIEEITWEKTNEIEKFTKNCHKKISELATTVTKLKAKNEKLPVLYN